MPSNTYPSEVEVPPVINRMFDTVGASVLVIAVSYLSGEYTPPFDRALPLPLVVVEMIGSHLVVSVFGLDREEKGEDESGTGSLDAARGAMEAKGRESDDDSADVISMRSRWIDSIAALFEATVLLLLELSATLAVTAAVSTPPLTTDPTVAGADV